MSGRVAAIAEERGIDLKTLQKGVYPVSLSDLLTHLEAQSGSFACASRRLRMPQFVPDIPRIRTYQWESVDQMLRRNGFVVAPCGSGKTLIGCLIGVLNGGRFLILTTRYVEQWKSTLENFFEPFNRDARIFVADGETAPFSSGSNIPTVVISTYAAFSMPNERHRVLKQLVYDTILLDEAHTAAARSYLTLIESLHSLYACGLTATKVREDNELEKLERMFRSNSKVVGIDRKDLVSQGFVADVQVYNLLISQEPMTDMHAHMEAKMGQVRMLGLHPYKIQVLFSALRTLCLEKHKTIVFCDDLFGLDWITNIADANNIPSAGQVSMRTQSNRRTEILNRFSHTAGPIVVFMSRTGDEALDLPSASASIVFWNNWSSRRQIVQRIGRLSRPHPGTHPVFLVLLLDVPKEIDVSKRREAFLQEHGFAIETNLQHESRYGSAELKRGDEYIRQLLSKWKQFESK